MKTGSISSAPRIRRTDVEPVEGPVKLDIHAGRKLTVKVDPRARYLSIREYFPRKSKSAEWTPRPRSGPQPPAWTVWVGSELTEQGEHPNKTVITIPTRIHSLFPVDCKGEISNFRFVGTKDFPIPLGDVTTHGGTVEAEHVELHGVRAGSKRMFDFGADSMKLRESLLPIDTELVIDAMATTLSAHFEKAGRLTVLYTDYEPLVYGTPYRALRYNKDFDEIIGEEHHEAMAPPRRTGDTLGF